MQGGFGGVGFSGWGVVRRVRFDFHGGEGAGAAGALEEHAGDDEGDLLVQDVAHDEAEQSLFLLHEEGPIVGVFGQV